MCSAKTDEEPDPAFDRAAYRERNVVERLINRLKQGRRVATRYGQLPPLLAVVAILLRL